MAVESKYEPKDMVRDAVTAQDEVRSTDST